MRFTRFNRPLRPTVFKNHFRVIDETCTGGTEQIENIGLGIDATTNRSTHIRAGALLKGLVVEVIAKTVPATPYKIECMLYMEKQGDSTLTTPLASYYLTTDPLTQAALEVRRGILSRPHTASFPGNQVGGPLAHFICRWKGTKHINDGDDIRMVMLSDVTVVVDLNVWITWVTN